MYMYTNDLSGKTPDKARALILIFNMMYMGAGKITPHWLLVRSRFDICIGVGKNENTDLSDLETRSCLNSSVDVMGSRTDLSLPFIFVPLQSSKIRT